jgi:hypothetical protein
MGKSEGGSKESRELENFESADDWTTSFVICEVQID